MARSLGWKQQDIACKQAGRSAWPARSQQQGAQQRQSVTIAGCLAVNDKVTPLTLDRHFQTGLHLDRAR
jgi:hypothetical protein